MFSLLTLLDIAVNVFFFKETHQSLQPELIVITLNNLNNSSRKVSITSLATAEQQLLIPYFSLPVSSFDKPEPCPTTRQSSVSNLSPSISTSLLSQPLSTRRDSGLQTESISSSSTHCWRNCWKSAAKLRSFRVFPRLKGLTWAKSPSDPSKTGQLLFPSVLVEMSP